MECGLATASGTLGRLSELAESEIAASRRGKSLLGPSAFIYAILCP